MTDAITTTTVAELDPDRTLWVTTNHRGTRTSRVHLSKECQHLRASDHAVIEKQPEVYPGSMAICKTCANNRTRTDGGDWSIYNAAVAAGRDGDE